MDEKLEQSQVEINLQTVRGALSELQDGLRKLYGRKAPIILIYGSYARGQARADSDIDILLLYPHNIHPAEEISRVSAVLADLNLRYGVLISVLPASLNKFKNSQETFWKNVRQEGISNDKI